MKACGIYARISRDDDGTALGVHRQLDDCTAEAERRGWPITRQFIDNDVSATSGKTRPAFTELLDAIEAGTIDAVIVWDIDRLTRTPTELEQFIVLSDRHGLALASIGGEVDLATPQGRLTARIKGSVARHEVEQASRRLKRKFQDNAKAGKPHGTIPFGYRRLPVIDDDGKVTGARDEIHEPEAAMLREAYARVISGESVRYIAKLMNETGHVTMRGNAWQGSVLARALQRPRYVGQRTHKGQIVGPGDWEPIVDQDTFDQATAILTAPDRAPARGRELKYLGSGIYHCGRCGEPMRPLGVAKSQAGRRQPSYGCPSCMKLTRQVAPVDEVVETVMIGRLARPDLIVTLSREPKALEAALRERDGLLARMDAAADQFAQGTITARQLARITDGMKQQLEAAERAVRNNQPSRVLEGMTGKKAAEAWAEASIERRRQIIRLLARVTILPSGSGIRFAPEQVQFDWITPESQNPAEVAKR